jgi:membrane-associated phospholipid phosphatase
MNPSMKEKKMELIMQQTITNFLRKYKHMILILYLPLYMVWFTWLERREVSHYAVIHCRLDDMIPFLEIFAIPYFLWFFYVVVVLFILFTQTEHLGDFYRCTATLMLGMTTCLIIYTLFPNAQQLRPQTLPRDNVLVRVIAALYRGDTPTNVCPSIHVYNSIAIHVAVAKSHFFQEKRGLKKASLILCILICLSTMFLKQHSVIDVVCGILLFALYYSMVYKPFSAE